MNDMHQLADSLAAESNLIDGCLQAAKRPAEPAAPPSLLHSLQDILSRFRSCIAGGNGEIEGDKEAIAAAEAAIMAALEATAPSTITITIRGGLMEEVTGIPAGYELRVEDYDGDDTSHPAWVAEKECYVTVYEGGANG